MKKPKNILRKMKMLIPGAALGIFGFLCLDHNLNRTKHRKEYGTRENPTYQITTELPKDTKYQTYFSTFAAARERDNNKLAKRIEELRELSTELYPAIFKQIDNLEEQVNSLESRLNSGDKEEESDILNKYFSIYKFFNNLNHTSDLITISLLGESIHLSSSNIKELSQNMDIAILNLAYNRPSEEDKDYENLRNKSKELFRKMTGKDWPSNLKMNIEDIKDKEVAGTYNHILGEIKSEKRSYPRTLSIIMHEAGHAASQQDEQDYYDSLNILTARSKRETDIVEEACAYAFQIASAYYEDAERSQERILESWIFLKDFIESYFNDNKKIHREAAALANAAIEYSQCPKKAFNYLATTSYENIHPQIRTIIANAKEQFRLSPIYKNQIDESSTKVKETNESLKSRLSSLEARISALETKLPSPGIDWGE